MSRSESLTVVICTYARSDLLNRCINALSAAENSRYIRDVLVVDNSSAQQPLDLGAIKFGSWLKLTKSEPGLSNARNKGLELAEGSIVAFVDDDATVRADWARNLLDAFGNKKIGVVGGCVHPKWEKPPPLWLDDEMLGALSVVDVSERSTLGTGQYVVGANMAFRTSLLREVGGFKGNLGRTANSLLGNEEHFPQDQIRAKGFDVILDPGVVVTHFIPKERLEPRWFIRRFAWQAVSDALSGPKSAEVGCGHSIESELEVSREYLVDVRSSLFSALVDGQWFPRMKEERPQLDLEQPESRPRRSVIPAGLVERIFVETLPGHSYLIPGLSVGMSVYSALGDFDVWSESSAISLLADAEAVADVTDAPIIIVTLDGWLSDVQFDRFVSWLSRLHTKPHAILHRTHTSPQFFSRLQTVSSLLAKVLVFGQDMKEHVKNDFRIRNVFSLYHPAEVSEQTSIPKSQARKRLGLVDSTFVVGIVGDLRSEKGLEKVLLGLDALRSDAANVTFVVAGRGDEETRRRIMHSSFSKMGSVIVDVRTGNSSKDYDAMSAIEYKTYVTACDLGCLLYQGDARKLYSGALPNFIANGAKVISARGSFVGNETERFGLGLCVDADEPSDVAWAIQAHMLAKNVPHMSDGVEEYLSLIKPSSASRRLSEALSDGEGDL